MRISIIIPAYNEQARIGNTLHAYYQYFTMIASQESIEFELVIVLNGCKDNTLAVVQNFACDKPDIYVQDIAQAGKGLAIKAGFADALTRANDWIGFVDADMATKPEYFYELFEKCGNADGVIASRYMLGAKIYPQRPFIKRWGSKIFYEFPIKVILGLSYYDYQCGAKLFKRKVIKTVASQLTVAQWAFDLELLYLCKKHNFVIKEIPTVWYDQAGGNLESLPKLIKSGLRMISAIGSIGKRH